MSEGIVVLGAGGHSSVVVSTARAAGMVVGGVYDDRRCLHGEFVLDTRVVGTIEDAVDAVVPGAVAAIGDNRDRRCVVERVPLNYVPVVHPSAVVADGVQVGSGSVVFAGATVQARTLIGDHAIINTGAIVDHDCVIGEFAHVAPGATVCGGVVIGNGVLVGAGAVIAPGITIGENAVVGAGSVVITDIADGNTVVGAPARAIGAE